VLLYGNVLVNEYHKHSEMSLAKMVMYLWIPQMMGNLLTSMKIIIFSVTSL